MATETRQSAGLMPRLQEFLGVTPHSGPVTFDVLADELFGNYRRQLIQYDGSEKDKVLAYLFLPNSPGPHAAVLIHHQHNGERHLGKSEVAGLAGNPLQAFGPALAERGFIVLAPDSICFEDRRTNKKGTEPDEGDGDFLQHFNEMTYRLAKGSTLMKKVLEDASIALSLVESLPGVEKNRIGVLGHSYGGNTTLFQAAIDARVAFSCSSAAACTYKRKMEDGIPFEFALTIPGISDFTDIEYLVAATAPRKVLIVSAEEDKYSRDAGFIASFAKPSYEKLGQAESLQHKHYPGGHALTRARFDFIVTWLESVSNDVVMKRNEHE